MLGYDIINWYMLRLSLKYPKQVGSAISNENRWTD